MSRSTNFHPPSLFVLVLLVLAALFSQVACSANQRTAAVNAAAAISNGVDSSLEEPDELVFAGQIEMEDGHWKNNYVAVLFQNGEEVARTTSRLLDAPLSEEGPMDGVFELRVKNEYKLTLNHGFYYYPDQAVVPMKPVSGLVGTRYIGTWFGNVSPDSMRIISVPEKQLKYAIVVLAMPQNELPANYRRGNLSLDDDVLVIGSDVEAEDETMTAEITAVSTPQSNVQFTVLPNNNGGLAWNMQMRGYYGTRWEVWEYFINGRVPGINWETFKESVLVHNPQLEADGFVFYPDKTYLLPLNQ
jgi:hypothetical protein